MSAQLTGRSGQQVLVAATASLHAYGPDSNFKVVREILRERSAQDSKWGEQNHPNGTGSDSDQKYADAAKALTDSGMKHGTVTWKDILLEEVREAFAEKDPAKIRAELIQVAAVAAQWVEAIDRKAAAK